MLFPVSKGRGYVCISHFLQSGRWRSGCWNNNKHAGATTHTLPSSKCLYIAVRGSDKVLAVAGIAIAQCSEGWTPLKKI